MGSFYFEWDEGYGSGNGFTPAGTFILLSTLSGFALAAYFADWKMGLWVAGGTLLISSTVSYIGPRIIESYRDKRVRINELRSDLKFENQAQILLSKEIIRRKKIEFRELERHLLQFLRKIKRELKDNFPIDSDNPELQEFLITFRKDFQVKSKKVRVFLKNQDLVSTKKILEHLETALAIKRYVHLLYSLNQKAKIHALSKNINSKQGKITSEMQAEILELKPGHFLNTNPISEHKEIGFEFGSGQTVYSNPVRNVRKPKFW